jgi:hypothetical protein
MTGQGLDLEKAGETVSTTASPAVSNVTAGNSSALLNFLKNNRIAAASRLSPEEIDSQIREEREAWDDAEKCFDF